MGELDKRVAWVTVPREPDDAMIEAGQEAVHNGREWGRGVYASEIWEAMLAAAPAPTVSGEPDWKRAFAAQSRKLQAVLHLPGVKEELASLDWSEGDDPAPTRAEVLEEAIRAQPATHSNPTESPYDRGYFNAVQDYADAIRALGEKP